MELIVQQILDCLSCNTKKIAKVTELIGMSKTPIEIVDLNLSVNDKFKILLRKEVLPEETLYKLADDFERSIDGAEKDPRSQHTVDSKRQLLGEGDKARATVLGAAWSAARDAAWSAAKSAIVASFDLPWYEIRDNVFSAWCDAWQEERSKQIYMLREVLSKIEDKQ